MSFMPRDPDFEAWLAAAEFVDREGRVIDIPFVEDTEDDDEDLPKRPPKLTGD